MTSNESERYYGTLCQTWTWTIHVTWRGLPACFYFSCTLSERDPTSTYIHTTRVRLHCDHTSSPNTRSCYRIVSIFLLDQPYYIVKFPSYLHKTHPLIITQEVADTSIISVHKFQRTKMSESPIPKTSACSSERSYSGRRHSYTSYCDKDMQYAFRRSLASIHFDCPPGRMRRSKHHSMADYCDSSTRRVAISDQSKIQDFEMTNSKPRRASMNDLSACAEPQRVSEFSPCSTFEKDGAIIQGILRVPSEF